MASYAALRSAMNTLNQIKRHPRPPIFISTNQMESLDQNLTFLLNFLERHSGEEDQDLDRRIAAAAYATEDVIDSHIVHQMHSGFDSNTDEDEVDSHRIHSVSDINPADSSQGMDLINTIDLYHGLERAIQDMEVIKREVTIKEKRSGREDGRRPLRRRHASMHQSNTIFEFDDVLINKNFDKLIAKKSFQVIPIVGMGGIGKTSLARNIYTNSVTIHHFDILVWVSISQEFSVPKILSQLLSEINNGSEDGLGERVHKMLWGRRYLIVMDDIWGIDAWDQVKSFFPDNNNGSRVMITTRLSKLAFDISGSRDFKINFLDLNKSLALFCKIVFGKEDCPIELEEIAKNIVRNCRGLPLSIVVIGGLLKNSNMTSTYWNYILEDLSSLINLEDDEYCLGLLHTSYKELSIHLKSCFLYMGIFREDDEIRVSKLIKLWVAEGILRPSEDKRLEEVAEEYIMELVERNLIYVHKSRWNGEVKLCRMHDLLRDLCLREGKKQRFLCAIRDGRDLRTPKYMNMVRRICIIQDYMEEDYYSQLFHSFESASLTRSLILQRGWPNNPSSFTYRLLRVLASANGKWQPNLLKAIFQNINLRCLNVPSLYNLPSSLILLWNLQTIKVDNSLTSQSVTAPSEIWEIVLLRHVMITNLQLPDPPCGENDIHLEDLQTLSCVTNFKCSTAVIKRIQNIRILKLRYEISSEETEYHRFYVNNFYHLKNLQALNLTLSVTEQYVEEIRLYMGQNLNFPHSLKKLTLSGNVFSWEECRTKIGLLPFLEYLKLDWSDWKLHDSWTEWETVEGQFCSLKFLHLLRCHGLRNWRTDNTHFPRLEHLVLQSLVTLKEIPSSIGHIPTLKSIRLKGCSKSAADSARSMEKEQIELGNEDLEFTIITEKEEKDKRRRRRERRIRRIRRRMTYVCSPLYLTHKISSDPQATATDAPPLHPDASTAPPNPRWRRSMLLPPLCDRSVGEATQKKSGRRRGH